MPPHCDTRDGPVVKAAIKALETGNLNYVLIWIPRNPKKNSKASLRKPCVREKPEEMQRMLLTTGSLKIPSGFTGPEKGHRTPE